VPRASPAAQAAAAGTCDEKAKPARPPRSTASSQRQELGRDEHPKTEGDASHSWEPTRAHDVLQRARLRRNVGNRRFFRARPRRHFWLSRAGLTREPRPQTGELAPHERMAGRSHPRKRAPSRPVLLASPPSLALAPRRKGTTLGSRPSLKPTSQAHR
jgi:hypothetical protein